MRYSRIYGENKIPTCPFCAKEAFEKNRQKIPVCKDHKNTVIKDDLKCMCGQYLVLSEGKFGIYFKCMKCGNISFDKAFEINDKMPADVAFEDEDAAPKRRKAPTPKSEDRDDLMREFLMKMKKTK